MSSKGVHWFGDKQEIELAVCNMNLLVMFGTLSYHFVVIVVLWLFLLILVDTYKHGRSTKV